MPYIHSFPAIADDDAKVLILGSIPGKASLQAQQYYAHPRNTFWRIMEHLLNIDSQCPYQKRCKVLQQKQVAVWDTLQTCTRKSSLDSDIDESSATPNDFARFFDQHTGIRAIFFNGATSEKMYLKYVKPKLATSHNRLPCHRLPSTSPAYAAMAFEKKLSHWTDILEHLPEQN